MISKSLLAADKYIAVVAGMMLCEIGIIEVGVLVKVFELSKDFSANGALRCCGHGKNRSTNRCRNVVRWLESSRGGA